MLTNLKLALATLMVLGAVSVASAEGFDPNLANRYPAYAAPSASVAAVPMHSANVGLRRNWAATHGQPYEFSIDQADHASSPYANG